MKTLFVMRHAKSSWDAPELADFERPLNSRGEKTAPFMGELLKRKNLAPQIIVSSPAERAKQTAELVRQAAELAADLRFEKRIYEAGTQSLMYILADFEDEFDAAMIVGHNPGFENLVGILCGEYRRMPTAALAVLDLDIEKWSEISAECGRLREFFVPKEEMKNFGSNSES